MRRLTIVFVLVVLVAGALYFYVPFDDGPTEKPSGDEKPAEEVQSEYHLKVTETSGPVEGQFGDTTADWESLQEGEVLTEGTRVRTPDTGSVEMVVPERAYLKFNGGSLEVSEVERDTISRSLGDTQQIVEANELELESEEGTLQNTVKEDTASSNEYRLRTPSAVMGVRGTTYGCDTDRHGSTSCAVLEGEATLANRKDTSQSVTIRSGQSSSVTAEDTEPEQPDTIAESREKELETVKSTAGEKLRKRPVVHFVTLGGTPLVSRTSLRYQTERTLRLEGRADSRGVSPLRDVNLSVNGRTVPVEGTKRWSARLTPGVPEPGSERVLTITVRATTDAGVSSFTNSYTVRLQNPFEVPPAGYEETRMNFTLEAIDGLDRETFEMPFTIYTDDRTDGTIELSGSVRSNNGRPKGLAYRVAGEDTWRRTELQERWSIRVRPPRSGEWSLAVIAWTDDRQHSPIETLGPFESKDQSYREAVEQSFEKLWSSFGKQQWSRVMDELSGEFQFDHPVDEPMNGDAFREVLDDIDRNVASLGVRPSINSISAGTTEAQIDAQLQWNGGWKHDYDGPLGFPPIATGYEREGQFEYTRDVDGVFRLSHLAGREIQKTPEPAEVEASLPLTIGQKKTLTLDHRSGIDLVALTDRDNSDNPAAQRQEGHLIVGLDPAPFEWSGEDPTLYANDGSHTFCSGYYCYDYPVQSGGIRRAEATSLSDVESFPVLTDGTFRNKVELESGGLYFVNVETVEQGQQKAILRVDRLNVSGTTDPPGKIQVTVIEVK